ncbi:MAG: Bcr/CflA family drug resistance efflux transporter [Actinobacteria bacterium]|nr:MAG: Bcr/CflA family drug resistance efflux transporter [Actinomycetota bacterium]
MAMTKADQAHADSGQRRGSLFQLVLLGALTANGPLAMDMYLPAFPEMTASLAATPTQVQLSLTTCLAGMALGQFFTGPLSDRWGRRRPVIIGTVGFALLSLLCAFAPNAMTLAALRFVHGFTGGMGVVVARAIVRDQFSGAAAARYYSRLTLIFGIAPIAAPGLGSVVLRFTSWRGIFVVLAALGALLALLVSWRLPETLPPQRRTAAGLGPMLSAIRILVADRLFIGYALAQGLVFAALFAYIAGSPFVFQDVFGLSDAAYSVVFGINSIGFVVLSQLNGTLVARRSPRRLLVGTLFVGVFAALTLLGGSLLDSLVLVSAALFIFTCSLGMVQPNTLTLALDPHPERAGTAAALIGTTQSMAGAFAAPLVGLQGSGTALPMAVVVLSALTMALVAVLTLARPRARQS